MSFRKKMHRCCCVVDHWCVWTLESPSMSGWYSRLFGSTCSSKLMFMSKLKHLVGAFWYLFHATSQTFLFFFFFFFLKMVMVSISKLKPWALCAHKEFGHLWRAGAQHLLVLLCSFDFCLKILQSCVAYFPLLRARKVLSCSLFWSLLVAQGRQTSVSILE